MKSPCSCRKCVLGYIIESLSLFGDVVFLWTKSSLLVLVVTGKSRFLGEAFASARVRGFQGPDLKAEDSLASCLKHFAGYGGSLASV